MSVWRKLTVSAAALALALAGMIPDEPWWIGGLWAVIMAAIWAPAEEEE